MASLDGLRKLLENEVVKNILESQSCKLKFNEITTLMKLLVNCNIPFTVSFSEGTRSESPYFTITLTLNPSTTISSTITLDGGIVNIS